MEMLQHLAPPEWPDLLAMSSQQLAVFGEATPEAAGNLYDDVVRGLGDERLEANWYHGLSIAMYGVNRVLKNPTTYALTLSNLVEVVAIGHFEHGAGHADPEAELDFHALRRSVTYPPICMLSRQVHRPDNVHLLSDTLDVATARRRRVLSPAAISNEARARDIAKIVNLTAMDSAVAMHFFGNARVVLAEALGVGTTPELTVHTPISALADEEKIRAASTALVAPCLRAATSMRVDTFDDDDIRAGALTSDAEGHTTFHPEAVPPLTPVTPTTAADSEPATSRHESVLGCPAVPAQLIPTVVARLFPDLIIGAQARVEELRPYHRFY